jgi:hypothetical protein
VFSDNCEVDCCILVPTVTKPSPKFGAEQAKISELQKLECGYLMSGKGI